MSATANALRNAADKGDKNEVARLLQTATKEDIQHSDTGGFGATALYMAVVNQHVEVAEMLIKAGADVSKATGSSHLWTPIMAAAYKGNEKLVKLLLPHFPDLTKKNCRGETAHDVATTPAIRVLLSEHAAKAAELQNLMTSQQGICTEADGVQARREWMQRRDALEVQYEMAEKALNFAQCAKLWQDITAHEKLSDSIMPSVEGYRTLADRHKKFTASVEAKCKELLAAERFDALETLSATLKALRAVDTAKLIFPADAKVSALPPATPTKSASTSNIVTTHTAKQADLVAQLQDLLKQHQMILSQAAGVKAREEWTQRRADLQAKFDAAQKAEDFAECAKLGKERVAADAEESKLALSAADYRTLGERYTQLVSKYKQLAVKRDQALVDLGKGRKELLAVKDFAGLEAMGQVMVKLQGMTFADLAPPPGVKLPSGFIAPANVAPATAPTTTTTASASTSPSSEVKLAYTADPVATKIADPVNTQSADPKHKSKKEKCTIM